MVDLILKKQIQELHKGGGTEVEIYMRGLKSVHQWRRRSRSNRKHGPSTDKASEEADRTSEEADKTFEEAGKGGGGRKREVGGMGGAEAPSSPSNQKLKKGRGYFRREKKVFLESFSLDNK